MITKFELSVFVFFYFVASASVLSQNCDKFPSPYYPCLEKVNNVNEKKCTAYAILHANSHYQSLSNLSYFLSIPRTDLLEANAFSDDVDFLSRDQPILIPIQCKCSSDGFLAAEVKRISIKGDSFFDIADSLEGLSTCNAIKAKNPSVSPWNIPEGSSVVVPLKCACPAAADPKFLLTYPVKEGDTLSELALKFNVSRDTLVSANVKYSASGFRQDERLVPISTLVIPSQGKPVLGFVERPGETIRVRRPHRRRRKIKMWLIGVYVAMGIIAFAACLGVGAAFFFINMKRKREEDLSKNGGVDLELQQLSLSIRTTSDKKVSFEGSQYNFEEGSTYTTTTPHKMRVESYTLEELQKATEDFSSTNLIGGSVFHGRLKGKDVAIKRVSSETIGKIEYEMVQEKLHRHPNIMRMLGTCLGEASDSFVVFENAKNGSLKDWIHGGLAIKSRFIASCSCFLNWNQRLKICLDVATALQHMHHVMSPSYVHRNVRSRNIFLDEDFRAKVGYFGLPMLGGEKESSSSAWDSGYFAPEYLTRGTISTGTDVFAYGVVVLEVLSGKPPTARHEEKEDGGFVKLSDEIKSVLQSEDAEELREWMDSSLGESYCFDGAVTLANLARSCVDDDVALRPNAGEIVEKLLRLVEELPEKDEFSMCESSCKPLVDVDAKEM